MIVWLLTAALLIGLFLLADQALDWLTDHDPLAAVHRREEAMRALRRIHDKETHR